jgi:hypothetical protein
MSLFLLVLPFIILIVLVKLFLSERLHSTQPAAQASSTA